MGNSASKVAACLCGAGCALCVALYTQGVSDQARQAQAEALERFGGEQVSVCVAKADLAAGQVVSGGDVEMRPWVSALLPEDPVLDMAEAVGQRASSPVFAGEALSKRRFQVQEQGLAVPDGLVAVSVPAKSVQVVGGAVRAGSVVDVYATGSSSTSLLEQGVSVLATSAEGSRDGGDLSWVTLALAPGRVQEIVAAAQTTQLYVSLPGEDAAGFGSQTPEPGGAEPDEGASGIEVGEIPRGRLGDGYSESASERVSAFEASDDAPASEGPAGGNIVSGVLGDVETGRW